AAVNIDALGPVAGGGNCQGAGLGGPPPCLALGFAGGLSTVFQGLPTYNSAGVFTTANTTISIIALPTPEPASVLLSIVGGLALVCNKRTRTPWKKSRAKSANTQRA
ncbi:MAG TPA: hypothetical protein VHZ55_32955, partial [Bryobacteraceae bacterium]|nr:hypothetical protein [Bryobacteraceae bacterium]